MTYTIKQGDVLEVTRGYPDNHFDGLFCDSPYGIGFMGKEWDHGVPSKEVWAEILRTMKPGAFGLVFGGTRTWHRLAVALEDAGFEIRDTLMWIYGSGFPKSYDISKGIDKAAGVEREVVGEARYGTSKQTWQVNDGGIHDQTKLNQETGLRHVPITTPATPEAQRWQGYGTALKPSWEPVLLIRKPLDGNNVQNALKHGCGGLNIDGSRIPTDDKWKINYDNQIKTDQPFLGMPRMGTQEQKPQGRWPANLILSHHPECEFKGYKKVVAKRWTAKERSGIKEPPSKTVEVWDCHPDCPIAMLDAQSGELGKSKGGNSTNIGGYGSKHFDESKRGQECGFGDSGGASRFFYCAKASRTERNAGLEGFEEKEGVILSTGKAGRCPIHGKTNPSGSNTYACGCPIQYTPEKKKIQPQRNHHPTVKPLDLCRYLAKLILPPEREGDPRRLNVPFCGSGSEMIGGLQAGWDEVEGCDIEADYLKIAEARLTHWCKREREKIPF